MPTPTDYPVEEDPTRVVKPYTQTESASKLNSKSSDYTAPRPIFTPGNIALMVIGSIFVVIGSIFTYHSTISERNESNEQNRRPFSFLTSPKMLEVMPLPENSKPRNEEIKTDNEYADYTDPYYSYEQHFTASTYSYPQSVYYQHNSVNEENYANPYYDHSYLYGYEDYSQSRFIQ